MIKLKKDYLIVIMYTIIFYSLCYYFLLHQKQEDKIQQVNKQYKKCCTYAQEFEETVQELDISTLLKDFKKLMT